MRMMLRFTLPVEKSNAAINDGSLGRTMESILSKLKPEAAYFAPLDGKRAGMIFFDMAEPSQIISRRPRPDEPRSARTRRCRCGGEGGPPRP
jgi:hypothetical protein